MTTVENGVQIITEARYAIVAVYCLQLYEWFANGSKEIDLVHRSRWTSVKVGYLLCRYYPLAIWPFVMFAYVGRHTYEACLNIGLPVHALLAPCQLFPQGVMLMRAYAFCGRDKRILVLLLVCYAGLFAINIWSFCINFQIMPEVVYIAFGNTGCYPYYDTGAVGFRIGYSMLAATSMDVVSLAVVLVHCFRNNSREISLGRYIVDQGLLSFAFVIGLNVAAACIFFNRKSLHNGIGLPFILIISNLIACRIILNLRRRLSPTESEIEAAHSQIVREALMRLDEGSCDVWLMEGEVVDRYTTHTYRIATIS